LSGDNYNRSRSQRVAVLGGGARRYGRLWGGVLLDPATCSVVRENRRTRRHNQRPGAVMEQHTH
jgi:hypothetical protein